MKKYLKDFCSHELRTPLTTILMLSQLLQKEDVSRDALIKSLKTIESSAKVQNEKINELLQMIATLDR